MDQIWLASPSPALRLWPGAAGATWRLNPAAMVWGRARQLTEASWRAIADGLGDALARSQEREGRLPQPPARWRCLPMSTGWLVWLMPEVDSTDRPPGDELRSGDGPESTPARERERTHRLARGIEAIADATDAGLWLLDLRTGEAEWNRQMSALHGLPPDAPALGFDAYVESLVHPDDREALRRARRQALDAGSARFDTEFRVVTPNGLRWIDYRSTRGRRDDRDLVFGVAVDAAERAEHRAAVDRAPGERGALERAGTARAEFLARMSHELRTPLNAVLGFAQLIEHDGTAVPVAMQLERVVHIREAGEQLLRLIGDVLEHLKREAPREEVARAGSPTAGGACAATADGSGALSVLYIEDNPVNVILVEELVAMRPNTSLRCAVTGLAGVALAAAAAPHVVLVDMQLPDIDGFEVLRRLRANRALDRSAVIALSANGMGDDIARALGAGFDDYWTKPIDFRHFLNGLDSLARAR